MGLDRCRTGWRRSFAVAAALVATLSVATPIMPRAYASVDVGGLEPVDTVGALACYRMKEVSSRDGHFRVGIALANVFEIESTYLRDNDKILCVDTQAEAITIPARSSASALHPAPGTTFRAFACYRRNSHNEGKFDVTLSLDHHRFETEVVRVTQHDRLFCVPTSATVR
jgi:hypothetical protein